MRYLLILVLLFAGCGQIVKKNAEGTELIKVNWLLYDWNLGKLAYKDLLIEEFDAESKNIKAITPYGTVETSD